MKITLKLEGIKDLNRVKEITSEIKRIPEVLNVEVTLSSEYDSL